MKSRVQFIWMLASGLALTAITLPTGGNESAQVPASQRITSVFRTNKLAEIDAAIEQAIAEKKLPGGVFWMERNGVSYHKAYGKRSLLPAEEPMTEDTIFDVASLTKVLATAPAVMLLAQRGKLDLDASASTYLPAFKGKGKDAITLRHLLTHTSGLPPGLSRDPPWSGYGTAIEMTCAERVLTTPGTAFHYSDINYIVLCEIVQRVSGAHLEEFTRRELYQPLKMTDTGFLPPASKTSRIAPTERVGDSFLRGQVHDPTARLMGGVSGHAGLFTTAADLACFARMMLTAGELEGVRIFAPLTVKLMTTVQTPETVPARRGLGWDIDSPYSGPRGELFPVGSYGHTGWTGTSLWIDPYSRAFVIFLSNRNHPTGQGDVVPLRRRLGTLAAEAIAGVDLTNITHSLPKAPPRQRPDTPR